MTDDRQIREQVEGVSVEDAAQLLGISENAVRLRIQRGSLESGRVGNRRIVYLSAELVQADSEYVATDTATQSAPAVLIEQLQSENQFLRDELRAVREDNSESERELRVMLAQQSAQLVDMAGQVRALEAGPAPSGSTEPPPSPDNDTTPAADDTDESEQPGGVMHRFWRFLSGPS